MLLSSYIQLHQFKKLIPDWVSAVALAIYFIFIAEHSLPFSRQFKLNDPHIQHPFAVQERVSGHMCLILAAVVPLLVMSVVTAFKHPIAKNQGWHMLNVSVLGLALCISVDGVITDILKAWIGQPRPDFLARCVPQPNTPLDIFVDASVCTAPLGNRILIDGMRSTPSGHSSISFSSFGYLFMWLYGQWRLGDKPTTRPLLMYIAAGMPLMFAAYIALSRVQDYRHSFLDISLGCGLGCLIAHLIYSKYFYCFYGDRSDELLDTENEAVLPI